MDFVAEPAVLAVTGRMGSLSYGASLPDLVAAYGEPVAYGRVHKKSRWPHWFGFGSLQMVFCRCRRLDSMIIPAWREELELTGPRPGELRKVDSRITEEALAAAITDAGGRWRSVEYENLTNQRSLETEPINDVRVGFAFTDRQSYDSPPLDDWILNKVNVRGFSHGPCPEPDRSLPDDGYGVQEPSAVDGLSRSQPALGHRVPFRPDRGGPAGQQLQGVLGG